MLTAEQVIIDMVSGEKERKIQRIVDSVNGGQVKGFKIARYLKDYPQVLYLDGSNGTFSIEEIEGIEESEKYTTITYQTSRGKKSLILKKRSTTP